MPTPQNDVEAELSYAYLHTVAARTGAVCNLSHRLEDNQGIDATVRVFGPFAEVIYRKSVVLDVQLKATVATPADSGTHFSYSFRGKERYEKLREPCEAVPCILVVLFLPHDAAQWMEQSAEVMLLRRCAYWVSLREAPPFTNKTEQTIYLPKSQNLTPESLVELSSRIARRDFPLYSDPRQGGR